MGEKMTNALAFACATATVSAVKTVRRINAKKAMRILFSATVAMITVSVFAIVAFAEGGDGEAVANEMIEKIKSWVGIIAGVVIVFGAVNAGLGVANQDEAGRNRGFMTMAGGAIMEAVVQVV